MFEGVSDKYRSIVDEATCQSATHIALLLDCGVGVVTFFLFFDDGRVQELKSKPPCSIDRAATWYPAMSLCWTGDTAEFISVAAMAPWLSGLEGPLGDAYRALQRGPAAQPAAAAAGAGPCATCPQLRQELSSLKQISEQQADAVKRQAQMRRQAP